MKHETYVIIFGIMSLVFSTLYAFIGNEPFAVIFIASFIAMSTNEIKRYIDEDVERKP